MHANYIFNWRLSRSTPFHLIGKYILLPVFRPNHKEHDVSSHLSAIKHKAPISDIKGGYQWAHPFSSVSGVVVDDFQGRKRNLGRRKKCC